MPYSPLKQQEIGYQKSLSKTNDQASMVVAALFGISFSISLAVAILILRSGLDTPTDLIINSLIFICAVLTCPFIFNSIRSVRTPSNVDLGQSLIVVIFFLAVIPLAVIGAKSIYLIYLFFIVGAYFFYGQLQKIPIPKKQKILTLFAGAFLGVYISLTNPYVYLPEQAYLELPLDAAFHLSISNMWTNYHVVSLGIDGLTPYRYHVLTHIWISSLARVLDVESIWIFAVAFKLIVSTLFYSGLINAVIRLSSSPTTHIGAISIVTVLITVLIRHLGWDTYNSSESYTLSLFFLMMALPYLINPALRFNRTYSKSELTILIIFGILISVTKISTGIIFFSVFSFIFLSSRISIFQALVIWVITVGLLATTITYLLQINLITFYRMVYPFALFRSFFWEGAVSNFVIPVLTILLLSPKSFSNAHSFPKKNYGSELNIVTGSLVLVIIIASIPGLVLEIPGGGAYYFLNTVQWVALPILLALIQGQIGGLIKISYLVRRTPITFVLSSIVLVLLLQFIILKTPNPYNSMASLVEAVNIKSEGAAKFLDKYKSDNVYLSFFGHKLAIGHLNQVERFFLNSITEQGVLFGNELKKSLVLTETYKLVEHIKNDSNINNKSYILFIPATNEKFWGIVERCPTKAFFLPALTGIPVLSGIPSLQTACGEEIRKGYKIWRGGQYGYHSFGPESHSTENVSENELCARSERLGFNKVLFINSVKNFSENKIIICSM